MVLFPIQTLLKHPSILSSSETAKIFRPYYFINAHFDGKFSQADDSGKLYSKHTALKIIKK